MKHEHQGNISMCGGFTLVRSNLVSVCVSDVLSPHHTHNICLHTIWIFYSHMPIHWFEMIWWYQKYFSHLRHIEKIYWFEAVWGINQMLRFAFYSLLIKSYKKAKRWWCQTPSVFDNLFQHTIVSESINLSFHGSPHIVIHSAGVR